jgi:hypothetical protein
MNWIRRAVSENLAWTLAAAVAIVAIVAIAMMPRKKEGFVSKKYPHWGWGKNAGLRCRYSNNTGCYTKQRRCLNMGEDGTCRAYAKPGRRCPYSFQTMGKDGKCRGCPPDTVWDGRRCKPSGKCRIMGEDGTCMAYA